MDVVIRTSRIHDEPLEQLAPTFEIDGKKQRAIVENELVTILDYDYMGRVETINVQGVAAATYLGMSVTEPAEKVFRVVERRGSLCVPIGGPVGKVSSTSPTRTGTSPATPTTSCSPGRSASARDQARAAGRTTITATGCTRRRPRSARGRG